LPLSFVSCPIHVELVRLRLLMETRSGIAVELPWPPPFALRCKAEARYTGSSSSSSSLADVLQSTYLRCQELSPKLDAAVDAEDLAAVRAVQQDLLALQAAVEGGVRTAKPPANVRRWLQVGDNMRGVLLLSLTGTTVLQQ
jgi:hypothetical protein